MRPDISFTINGVTKVASNLGLILGPFDIPVATPKLNYIEIDGADSALDLSEAFGLTYNDLTFDINFQIKRRFLHYARSFISFAHGKRAQIWLYNDEDRYYDGRLSVGNIVSQNGIYSLTVSVIAKPYRLKKDKTIVTVTDAAEGKLYKLTTESMPVVPTFTCKAETRIVFQDKGYTITSTSPVVLPDIVVRANNWVKVTSTDEVTIEYQEGEL